MKKLMAELDGLNQSGIWRPFGTGNFIELLENADAPQAEIGVAHIIANLKPTRRPPLETMQDFLENIVPQFKAE